MARESRSRVKIVLKIAYQGGPFAGFQRQASDKTVQGTLESVLGQILGHPVALAAAGRTDQGVHASGQVVAFQTDRNPNLNRLCRSANGLLRDPIAVLEAASLPDDDPFHPRYSALERSYSYFLLDRCGPREARFWADRVWCLPQALDLDLARQAAALFVGELDFSTFSYKMEHMASRVRKVSRLEVTAQLASPLLCPDTPFSPSPHLYRLSITSNGFLRRMVRLVTAGLVEVASGLRSLSDLSQRLQACDPSRSPHPAPPHGLYLERVLYCPDPFEQQRGTPHHAVATARTAHRLKVR